jgi:PIN domain nuclease of toxin-antitoxin system
MAIKLGLGKLALSASFAEFTNRAIEGYEITLLAINVEDCAEYAALPFPLREHRDPFDRLIIVQSRRNGIGVVGADARFDAYSIQRFW